MTKLGRNSRSGDRKTHLPGAPVALPRSHHSRLIATITKHVTVLVKVGDESEEAPLEIAQDDAGALTDVQPDSPRDSSANVTSAPCPTDIQEHRNNSWSFTVSAVVEFTAAATAAVTMAVNAAANTVTSSAAAVAAPTIARLAYNNNVLEQDNIRLKKK